MADSVAVYFKINTGGDIRTAAITAVGQFMLGILQFYNYIQ